MNNVNIYIYIGVLVLIGLLVFRTWNSKHNSIRPDILENINKNSNTKNLADNRILKLVVSYNFGEDLITISENVTSEIIKNTMESIDWNKFHIVQLEDHLGNALNVSGSLVEDGIASGLMTSDDQIVLKVNPPKTVKEMTEILIDFLKGEEIWRNKYLYK